MTVGHGRTAIVVGLLALVNACASYSRTAPPLQERVWPAYLGGSMRAGRAETLTTDPQPVWRASLSRGIVGAPALTEDLVIVALADHRVAVLERATGTLIWARRLALAIGGGPLVSDDRIFVAEQARDGRVYALRLSNGTTIWSARSGDVTAPLALDDSALYAGTLEGNVSRLDPASGVQQWRTRLPGAVRAALAPVPGGVAVATTTDSIFLLDAATGAIRARRATRGAVLAAPAVADSLVIIGTANGRVEALDAATLRPVWSFELGEPVVGSIAVLDGRVYALSGRGTLATLPVRDITGLRRIALGIVARAGPTPTAQGVYVCTVSGEIILVDLAGTRKWTARMDPPINEPVLADHRTLVAASVRGDVVMYR